jgi:Multidrug resistance efflux pump
VAPEDGLIINLQVRPGMVAGDYRIGAIASLICDDGRYLLAAYYQEILKYVAIGQPVEVALNLYPGQIFRGKVQTIWKASGEGQYLPSGACPCSNRSHPRCRKAVSPWPSFLMTRSSRNFRSVRKAWQQFTPRE